MQRVTQQVLMKFMAAAVRVL